MNTDMPTVPCQWCGTPTTYTGTRECNTCHEVRRGVQSALMPADAIARIVDALRPEVFEFPRSSPLAPEYLTDGEPAPSLDLRPQPAAPESRASSGTRAFQCGYCESDRTIYLGLGEYSCTDCGNCWRFRGV